MLLCFEGFADVKREESHAEIDYRRSDLTGLLKERELSKIEVDLTKFNYKDLEEGNIVTLYDTIFSSNEHHGMNTECNLYISSFTSDLSLLYGCIEELCKYLLNANTRFNRIVFVKDLIYVDRPYTFDSKQIKFFRKLDNLSEKYPSLHIMTTSSQELLNRWGEGDTYIVDIPKLLLEHDGEELWRRLHQEIPFCEMKNQGNAVPRLISIQSIAKEMGRPIYRHPNDCEPPNIEMLPIVKELLHMVEETVGVHGLNHVLIQHYRDGRDNIATHSDKTLDIHLGTPIINFSVGQTRKMYLQYKANKTRKEEIVLRHGQCVVLGLRTNQHWWHEIPKEVTLPHHPVFGTGRISFTFRRIETYLAWQQEEGKEVLIGQGSPYKSIADYCQPQEQDEKQQHLPPRERDRSELIAAFSRENKQHEEFDWMETYGEGFLLH